MEITLDNVNFSYDDSPVLHNISLTLNEPGLVCIIGPNGVGKSTLIKCINKILHPDSGQIFLNNKNINDMSFKEISKIMGYVPAAANDMFSMTVIDSILIGRYPHKIGVLLLMKM